MSARALQLQLQVLLAALFLNIRLLNRARANSSLARTCLKLTCLTVSQKVFNLTQVCCVSVDRHDPKNRHPWAFSQASNALTEKFSPAVSVTPRDAKHRLIVYTSSYKFTRIVY
jgi:hypothetical protein